MDREETFMVITTLARVRVVSTIIGQIYTGDITGIDEDERRQIAIFIQKWEDRLAGKVEKAEF